MKTVSIIMPPLIANAAQRTLLIERSLPQHIELDQ